MKPGMFCAGRIHEGLFDSQTKAFDLHTKLFVIFPGGHDACQGDSGGLITCGGQNELSGVISFGDSCGVPEFPGNMFAIFKKTRH